LPEMQSFFHDSDTIFRIFIQRNEYKCTSGRGLHRGFVFAWNEVQEPDGDLTGSLFHEIVHNWPRLGFSAGGPTPAELADEWFNEGIADYYSLMLTYRFGVFTEHEFVVRFNQRLPGYYTNSDRKVSNSECA
jgi:predicted metalloprotease with PDZ domain